MIGHVGGPGGRYFSRRPKRNNFNTTKRKPNTVHAQRDGKGSTLLIIMRDGTSLLLIVPALVVLWKQGKERVWRFFASLYGDLGYMYVSHYGYDYSACICP